MTDRRARTALIVGASRGLGLALAGEFLARGRQVTGTVRGSARTPLHELVGEHDGRLEIETVDVTVDVEVEALHERLRDCAFDLPMRFLERSPTSCRPPGRSGSCPRPGAASR